MTVPQEIVEWSQVLSTWQRDALRRIMTTAELSQSDEDEVYALAKTEYGLPGAEKPPQPVPLSIDHVPAAADADTAVTLLSIHDVANVNALAAEQTLLFAPTGLTVVYGENATGKSGYSRVLKSACRARDAEQILPNVMEETSGVAEAQFDLEVGEETVTVAWRDGDVPPEVLSAIAIFDSASARVFVDSEDEVRFLPYGLDAFARLGNLCGRVKERLQTEFGSSHPDSGAFSSLGETEASRLVAALDADCCPIDAAVLAHLSPPELKELDELRAVRLRDPTEQAKAMRLTAKRIRGLADRTKPVVEAASSAAIAKMKLLAANARASWDAAKLASDAAFRNEPLPGVGSDSWRQMYEAARLFSETEAYSNDAFPALEAGSRCVLCQQPLAESAVERMRRFEAFVADETATNALRDERAFREAVKKLREVDAEPEKVDPSVLDELRQRDADLAERVLSELDTARAVRNRSLAAAAPHDWDKVSSSPMDSVKSLVPLAEAIEDDAVKVEGTADPAEKARISSRLAELEARQGLGGQIPQVAATIKRKKTERSAANCVQSADTNMITRKGGELHKAAVTEALQARLQEELEAIGVTQVPLEVADRGSSGRRLHRMKISGAATAVASLSGVLSEGEHRAVAIAAMLAECGLQGTGFPIVFDDPVSSLDHRYRERVARRLVREAENRQVIVLTHDVFFLTELQLEASLQGVATEVRGLKRVGPVSGVCDEDKPWQIMSIGERLNWCLVRASGLQPLYDSGATAEYEKEAGFVADRLRSTVEEVVEECVFCKVVTRFQNNVMMLRLKDVVYDNDDYRELTAAYATLSKWTPAHSGGAGAQREVPTPADLREVVSTIQKYVKTLKKRQKAAAEARAN